MEKLLCRVCNEYKNKDDFYKAKYQKQRNGYSSECKVCNYIRCRKDYTLTGKNIPKTCDDFLKRIYNSVKGRCSKRIRKGQSRSIDFDISLEDIKTIYNNQNGLCAISKIEMTWKTGLGNRCYTNISLDRIDSSAGYTKDNIQLVCYHVNTMKNDLNMKDLIYFCRSIIINNEVTHG